MDKFGVYINYKIQYRYAWICCMATTIVFLLLLVLLFPSYSLYEDDYSVFNLIDFCLSSMLQLFAFAAPAVPYITLLCYLYQRFTLLNSLFRC